MGCCGKSGRRPRGLTAFILILILWLGVDALYARITQGRLAAWETTITRGPDGVRAGCEAFAGGAGDVTLLLVHGFADSPALFRRMASPLLQAGYRIRALRLPGFAESPVAASSLRVEDWTQAIVEALDAERAQGRSVWIAAHSLGAAISLEALRGREEAVDGLILIAPLFNVSSNRSPLFSPQTWFKLGKILLPRSPILENRFPVDVADPAAAKNILRDRFIHRQVYNNLFELLERLHAAPLELHCPLFMALTNQDQVIDSPRAQDLFARWPGPAKTLFEYNASGHVLPLDAEWQPMTQDILHWLEAVRER